MTPTDLQTFLQTRRSIRRFTPELIPDSVIERILTTATYAPSAHHRQPWRFAVIADPQTKRHLAKAMAITFRKDLEADSLSADNVEKKIENSLYRIINAPIVIILSAEMSDMDVYPDTRRKKAEYIMAIQSVANAGLQLLLAAHAEGLGGVWVCGPLFAQETVKSALDLPDSWEPQAMFYLGYPAENPQPRERKPIKEITKTFGHSND